MQKRSTPAKQLIREALETADSALSQSMLEEQLNGRADRVTIYRVLNSFCDDGLVHRVVSDDGKAYYALCHGCRDQNHRHEHAHFRCLGCQKVECLKGTIKAKMPEGYRLENANYWISGYCAACA